MRFNYRFISLKDDNTVILFCKGGYSRLKGAGGSVPQCLVGMGCGELGFGVVEN